MLSERLRRFGPLALVTLSLAMALYYQALLVAPLHDHSAQAFYDLDSVWPPSLVQAWKSRVLSLLGARWLASAVPLLPELPTSLRAPTLETLGIAQWVAFWFLGICAIQIAARRERALFPILGTYAGVVFGYSVGLDLRIYPWDMPALAVYTGFVALVQSGRAPAWILLAIWAGMPFKETAAVLCLFPLALEMSWRQRAAWAGAALLGCAAIKIGIDLATQSSAVGLTMAFESFYDEGPLWWWNLRQLSLGYPLLANGGTLLAFLLLPNASRTLVAFKAIALAFAAGNFLFGIITESRIWFEMIPLALYGLEGTLRSEAASR
jgi:hypothetical protein